jgi:hypothetical protein
MKNIVRLLLSCFISLPLAAHHHSSASEEFHSLKQGERTVTGPLLLGESTRYTRDFDGGYVTLEVGDTIVFSITVTGDRYYACNVPKTIEQNGNHYEITSDSPEVDAIHITWSNFNGCDSIDAGQTATGTMSVFPFSFTIEEPFRLYYVIGIHGEDYFDIAPGIPSTTTSSAATTSSTATTSINTSTTTQPLSLCLAEKIYGEYAEETALLRLVRDELLSNTPEGQALIRLYYQWDTLLGQVIGDDEGITEEVKELIDEILPVFEEMLE